MEMFGMIENIADGTKIINGWMRFIAIGSIYGVVVKRQHNVWQQYSTPDLLGPRLLT